MWFIVLTVFSIIPDIPSYKCLLFLLNLVENSRSHSVLCRQHHYPRLTLALALTPLSLSLARSQSYVVIIIITRARRIGGAPLILLSNLLEILQVVRPQLVDDALSNPKKKRITK